MMASAIMAWACLVSFAMALPKRCQSGEYSCATRLKTSTKSSSPALRLIAATRGGARGGPLRVRPALVGETPELGQVLLVGPLRRQLAGDLLEDDAGLEDLVEARVDPVQVQHHRVDDRPHGRLGDDEPSPGTASGASDLLVLHQAHGLPEHGPADLVALEEIGLGAEHLANRPTEGHDILDDAVRHLGRPFGVRIGARARHVACRRRGRHPPILPGQVHPATLLTSAFAKRVVGKGAQSDQASYNENMICEEAGGWRRR